MSPSVSWDTYRAEFPVFEKWSYFGWASVAALSTHAVEAMALQLKGVRDNGAVVYRDWYQAYEETRREASLLLGSKIDEIALIKNTSEGVSTVAYGLNWAAGDNIVLPKGEFPANAYPWLSLVEKGVEVRRIDVAANGAYGVDDVVEKVDSRTRVVALSFVNYATGFQARLSDIGELCRKKGILFFVDAIQGLGVLPLDVAANGIDALAADGHKWLCGPEGQGILYIGKEWQDRIQPLSRGWWSARIPGRYDLDDQALCDGSRRYECGTLTTLAVYGLRAALRLINDVGVENLAARITELRGLLEARLREAGFRITPVAETDSYRSGIVSFEVPGQDARKLAYKLEQEDVVVNPRDGRLRAALHGWNSEDDIQRLMSALGRV